MPEVELKPPEEIDPKKLKDLFIHLIPDFYLIEFYPHKEQLKKDLTKAKRMLEEMGI